jgi:hypothetical protein
MKSSSNETGIDQLLSGYFRREMPSRWPAAPGNDTTVANPTWTLTSSRLLVGMSLVALLAIYVGLASFFPREQASGVNPGQPLIGQRPGLNKTSPVSDQRP